MPGRNVIHTFDAGTMNESVKQHA